jgi:Short C-terminal domain
MRMRVSLSSAMLLLTGCAGPLGPPFGPGPEADSLFGILVILLFGGLLYRSAKGWRNPKHSESPAIHILRERYARGELTREQFQNMMRDLSAS